MANGRPPKPTELHLIEGTGRKHRLDKRDLEPTIDEGIGSCPEILSGDARDEWQRLVRAMPEGVYRATDRAALIAYCHQWAGIVETIREGVLIEPKVLTAFVSLAGRLGLTPSDRSRLAVTQPKKDENAFAALG